MTGLPWFPWLATEKVSLTQWPMADVLVVAGSVVAVVPSNGAPISKVYKNGRHVYML